MSIDSSTTLVETSFSTLPLFRRGKVRDVYDTGASLLFVATDRLSAFDVVMPNPIPLKGAVLTALSQFWFQRTGHICKNHFLSSAIDEFPAEAQAYRAQLEGRSMVVRKTKPLSIECIVRGYISGSGWKEYKTSQSICGIHLPANLRESEQLPAPIFTPSTKAEEGHDQNISFEEAARIVGSDVAERVRYTSIALYSFAHEYALARGIIIADTKFEFGLLDGDLILIDEVLTPDSSRFWPMSEFNPGRSQPSFDKQFVRDYLESIAWNKKPPAPELPEEVVVKTSQKYVAAFELLTGESFLPALGTIA